MLDDLRNNVRKVAFILIGLLVMLFIYVSYLQIIQSDFLAAHALNHRFLIASMKMERGQVFDKNGEVLAYSKADREGRFKRYYPFGEITAHVVGYSSTRYGTTGLESAFNGYLSGMTNPQRRLGPIGNLWDNKIGNSITLTIDSRLQQTAFRALGNRRGAVVVLNPRSGAILAMVSKPSFEPADIDDEWNEVSNSTNSPLLNRATQGLYPPGSVLKVMIADAALAEKVTDSKKTYNCQGSLKIGDYELSESNHKAHGKVDLEEAMAVSCNVTFGQLALDLGRNRMAKAFERYGFNRSLPDELQEVPSRLPNFSGLSDGDLAQVGIGQASLLVTPLRMAMLAASIANKGVIMKPYLVSQVTTPEGSIINEYEPSQFIEASNYSRTSYISKMMVAVVAEGTGSASGVGGIQVAGKTGTAENPHGIPHAWYIGFAPADNPEIAIAVIVENGGSGGEIAAPIARQVIIAALR